MNYPELLHEIMLNGHKVSPHGKEIKELNYVQLEIDSNLFSFEKVREVKTILTYWHHELSWYMSGIRDSTYIARYAKLWKEIKNADNTANSNYGHLVFYNRVLHPSLGKITLTPFEWAFTCLNSDIDSRQAVITYNTGGFNFINNKDYICTQHQAFFIRNMTLNCYVALRSSDVIYGLPYNMLWWSIVMQQLYLSLKAARHEYENLKLGNIRVTIYSAHAYQQHYELIYRMTETNIHAFNVILVKLFPLVQDIDYYERNAGLYLTLNKI